MSDVASGLKLIEDELYYRGTEAAAQGIRALFDADSARFDDFSLIHEDLVLDYSRTALSRDDLKCLVRFAIAKRIEARRDAMFGGERINTTEDRPALHVALRGSVADGYKADGVPVGQEVENTLTRMSDFVAAIREGAIVSSTGDKFTDVVNIGIGGSDLGPAMATLALAPYHDGPRLHFVSNVDSADITGVLSKVNPATTLFIIASKTFTTIETMTNAETARGFVTAALGEEAVVHHFCAVSTALDKIERFGINRDRIFGFWDWVGGRYSIWSAIGLPLMIAIGPAAFREFLAGARSMDQHFRHAPIEKNMPMLLGLVGWWHRVAQGYGSRALLPYDQRLARFPAYVQQLDMESNGKTTRLDGHPARTPTGPVVWGEPGTNGQHAFFQLLHQGTDVVPVEFLIGARSHEPGLQQHQDLLIANCIAQGEALVQGRTLHEVVERLHGEGCSDSRARAIAPHRQFSGNRPSITLLYRKLDPHTLGRLIALFEHRVFVEAQLFEINPFDQWGVELGKELALKLLPAMSGAASITTISEVSRGLATAVLGLKSSDTKER